MRLTGLVSGQPGRSLNRGSRVEFRLPSRLTWSSYMTRFLVAMGVVFQLTNFSLAQSTPNPAQCDQIRQAVANYGYVAAKRHALANYGVEAVRAGDRCLTKKEKDT